MLSPCPGAAGNTWSYAGSTTKTRFRHNGQTPGVALDYRCYAERGGLKSPDSFPASVYLEDEGGESDLHVAA